MIVLEMTMDEGDTLLTQKSENPEKSTNMTVVNEIDDIICSLTANDKIIFKNQQRGEADPTNTEKTEIALSLFENSKLNFLLKFGKYLKQDQLKYFEQFADQSQPDAYEIKLVLKDLYRLISENAHHVIVKNRRYEALKQMVEHDNAYFSEIEMMKRNPLLYEQLVGQYLTEDEKRERDREHQVMNENTTLVKILMEGIDRDNAEIVRKMQEENEDDQTEEVDTSSDDEAGAFSIPKPSTLRWGEFEDGKAAVRPKSKKRPVPITAEERMLLQDEFKSNMYQHFLDGKDEDFDYNTVDNDNSYDNINEIEHDEEDKYFDSEDPEDTRMENNENESSEDELDMYMNGLNQHPAVCQLAKDITKL